MTRQQRRKAEGIVALSLSTVAAFLGLFWLVFILGDVLIHGMKSLNLSLFANDPAPAGIEGGGLRNAFVGQVLITLAATAIGGGGLRWVYHRRVPDGVEFCLHLPRGRVLLRGRLMGEF